MKRIEENFEEHVTFEDMRKFYVRILCLEAVFFCCIAIMGFFFEKLIGEFDLMFKCSLALGVCIMLVQCICLGNKEN